MAITRLEEVKLGATDDSDKPIEIIYALDRKHYAVYGTASRIGVQFSDEPKAARAQRLRLAKIQVLRGQINGLIDGWRASKRNKAKAARFDRRGADAIVMALEGDVDDARSALAELKQDIVEDRISWARFYYLIVSGVLAAVAVLITFATTSKLNDRTLGIFACETWPLFFAGAAGAIGAFFSIAIGIHNRTVLTDQNMRDNLCDAFLRVLIGVVSAVALMCLLYSKAVTFTGMLNPDFTAAPADSCFQYSWSAVITIAFVAGFSERLVPDLLARTEASLATGAPAAPGSSGGGAGPSTPSLPKSPDDGPAGRIARRLGLRQRTRSKAAPRSGGS
jgi:hypothetical protein